MRRGHTEILTLRAAGDSEFLVFPDADIQGVMISSYDGGTAWNGGAVATKGTLNPSAVDTPTAATWKTLAGSAADISGGVGIIIDPWSAIHFDAASYTAGQLVVEVKPF